MENLREALNTYPQISQKKHAESTITCYQYLLKASKKPIANQVYDPTMFNYEEVEKIIRKKIQIEDIDFKAIAETVKIIEPISSIDDFKIDTEFTLRNDESTYKVVYVTETHVVFIANDSTQPRVMNQSTFLHQSPRIIEE